MQLHFTEPLGDDFRQDCDDCPNRSDISKCYMCTLLTMCHKNSVEYTEGQTDEKVLLMLAPAVPCGDRLVPMGFMISENRPPA